MCYVINVICGFHSLGGVCIVHAGSRGRFRSRDITYIIGTILILASFNSDVSSMPDLNSPFTNWSHPQPCGINVGQERVW